MKCDSHYYVGICREDSIDLLQESNLPQVFVTGAIGEKPLAMSKSKAFDIAAYLCMNLHRAVVVDSLGELDDHALFYTDKIDNKEIPF